MVENQNDTEKLPTLLPATGTSLPTPSMDLDLSTSYRVIRYEAISYIGKNGRGSEQRKKAPTLASPTAISSLGTSIDPV